MVFEDFQCEKCEYVIKDVEAPSGDKLPKRKVCPECGGSCYRKWGNGTHSIIIPEHFKANTSTPGNKWAKEKMKNYKGQNKKKRFY